MGVNLFVEGKPAPVVIAIRLPRRLTAFTHVREVTEALTTVDSSLRSLWPSLWPEYRDRRRREVYLLRFEVSSPPYFEVLSDPAWLAVFLLIITNYKQGKESLIEASSDLSRLAASIRGLSARELELLEISIRLSVGRLAELGEQASLKIAKRFRAVRAKVMGATEDDPEIEVKDVENKHREW